MLELWDVSKRYEDVAALDNCTFRVRPGAADRFRRPERCRQDNGDACDLRACHSRCRDGPLVWACSQRHGSATFTPQQRFLAEKEAFDVATQFRREHPHRLRFFSTILGWGDLRDDARVREYVGTHPFVAFRPTDAPAPQAIAAPKR